MKKYPFDLIVTDSTSKFHKIKKEDYLLTVIGIMKVHR